MSTLVFHCILLPLLLLLFQRALRCYGTACYAHLHTHRALCAPLPPAAAALPAQCACYPCPLPHALYLAPARDLAAAARCSVGAAGISTFAAFVAGGISSSADACIPQPRPRTRRRRAVLYCFHGIVHGHLVSVIVLFYSLPPVMFSFKHGGIPPR